MNPMIKRFVDQSMLTEAEGLYIEEAINRKETIIISGHRSAGTRPFMASLMAVAKTVGTSAQIKDFDGIKEDVDYLLIPGIDGIDFEKLIFEAMKEPNKAFVSIKEPEHPYSIMKLMRDAFKETNDNSKVYQVLECDKFDNVPKVVKITEMKLNDKGRMEKADFKG